MSKKISVNLFPLVEEDLKIVQNILNQKFDFDWTTTEIVNTAIHNYRKLVEKDFKHIDR